MKKLFYFGLLGLALYEIANVYFIMPMPGSQRMNSIDLAYFLYSYRWWFRIIFIIMIMIGTPAAFSVPMKWKWVPVILILPVAYIVYTFNFNMTADHMFVQPENLVFKPQAENALTDSSIVVTVSHNNETKAYPIRFIQYHHQVRDVVGGKPVMVTYCNVCRTGRVFEPSVNGKPENFRLVGMDHFNAMFEDETTGSWWRQANGEAITGSMKGTMLPEVESNQMALRLFFMMYPTGTVMQREDQFRTRYDSTGRYEKGRSKGMLTRTDSLSWKDKSWVVGIDLNGSATAYDWFDLKKKRAINDKVGDIPVLVVISSDDQSFAAFKRQPDEVFTTRNDSLIGTSNKYDLMGRSADGSRLEVVKAYQEFWHSWRTFHPNTATYKAE
ncbi:MAG TPA: DUF3179 domain-containing (seleno)protein [Cyclobacteriaceae bacterium]|nr:DUF3179 domain-containing (seleno)protein [Cyclobacteriaceae bacterium]